MPPRGEPTSGGLDAKLVYSILKLQHEYFNNGFVNAMDEFKNAYKEDLATEEFKWGFANMLGFLYYHGSSSAGDIIDYYRERNDEDDEDEDEDEDDEDDDDDDDDDDEEDVTQ
jgi:hypothetical protein